MFKHGSLSTVDEGGGSSGTLGNAASVLSLELLDLKLVPASPMCIGAAELHASLRWLGAAAKPLDEEDDSAAWSFVCKVYVKT